MDKVEQRIKDTYYGVKTISVKVTDLDEGSRQVKGYFSSFNTLDAHGDVIREGSFKKSIKENGPNSSGNRSIAHLRNHDWDQQIGKLDELFEDSFGLGFVSTMGRSTKGNDAFLDYQDGILIEHSIGYNLVEGKIKHVDDKTFSPNGHNEITELKLWEGSGVTFGSNSLTPVVDVAKGLLDQNITLKRINELTNVLENALKNGKGTDDRLENIEQMFAQLKQLHNSLNITAPDKKSTQEVTPKKSTLDYLLNI